MMPPLKFGLPSFHARRHRQARVTALLLWTLTAHSTLAQTTTTSASPVQAPPSVEDKAAADALFDSALKMMQEGKYNDACEKLQKSHSLDPAVGTLLNLGRCYRERGETASAWTTYREAASMARKEGQTDRETLARDEAQELETRLIRVRLNVSEDVKSLPGLTIAQNGQPISLALIGEALPVNPGLQTFDAKADGASRTFTLEAKQEGQTYSLTIDQLNASPGTEAKTEQAGHGEEATNSQAEQHSETGEGGKNYVGPIVLGASGLVGIGVGTAFAFIAQGHDNKAREICKDITEPCTSDDVDEWDEELSKAKSSATVAYIGWGVGGAALAGAVVWWLLDSPATESSATSATVAPILTENFWGVSAKGTF